MQYRIVIMAGGTGGHVFPALAVAQHLRDQGWCVTWLGTQSGLEAKVVPAQGFEIDWLQVSGIRGKGLLFKIKSLGLLITSCLQARRYLRQRQPQVVLGMGGFVAAPGGLMAKWLGIPLIIHEQNRVVGTTNRWLAKIADQVLEAFPDSFSKKYQAVCTGNPLRKHFLAIPNRPVWQAEQRPLHILVVGGSQGAKILNEIVPQAVSLLSNVAVKHQTGEAMFATVQAAYSAYQINAQVLKFIEDMNQAYQWADLIICRAGAMTVSEVAAVGLPAIFVPLPNAIDDHQTANARYLTESQAGILLLQKELTANSLANLITQNLTEFQKIGLVAKNKAWLNATETVANIVIEVARVDK